MKFSIRLLCAIWSKWKLMGIITQLWLLTIEGAGQNIKLTAPFTPGNSLPVHQQVERVKTWSLSASVLYNFVPGNKDVIWPIFNADHDWLHLEGRYNYEDLKTISAWIGYNFSGGKKIQFEMTPMVGGLIGNTRGVGVGAELSFNYHQFDFYNESEYIFDLPDAAGNFLYSWSELGYSPTGWLRMGLAMQHTKEYQANGELQRGIMAGFTWKKTELTGFVFDPDKDNPLFVLGLDFIF
jgi:hypothetical protein